MDMSALGLKSAYLVTPGIVLVLTIAAALTYALKQKTLVYKVLSLSSFSLSQRLKIFSLLLPVILVSFALLQPYLGRTEVTLPNEGQEIMVVFDVSDSMNVKDVSPNRLAMARRKVLDLIDSLEESEDPYRMGLLLFAGAAYVYCPVTQDLGTLRQYVRAINTTLITSKGSALNEALLRAARTKGVESGMSPLFLLVTDGDDPELSTNAIASALAQENIPLAIWGFGTEAGGPVPSPRGRYYRDDKGNTIISRTDERALTTLASSLDGLYVKAQPANNDIRQLTNWIAAASTRPLQAEFTGDEEQTGNTIEVFNEVGSLVCLGAAIALLLAVLMLPQEFGIVVVLVSASLAFSPDTVSAADTDALQEAKLSGAISEQEAQRAFENGEFEPAARGFEAAYQQQPTYERAARLGAALFRLRNFSDAASAYQEALELSALPRDRFEALYNRGNALLQQQNFDGAIEAYESALEINSNDEATTFNRDLALKLKEQAEQQKQQQEQESSDESSDEESSEKSEQGEDSSENQQSSENDDSASSEQSEESKSQESQPQQSGDEHGSENEQTQQSPKNKEDENNDEPQDQSEKNEADSDPQNESPSPPPEEEATSETGDKEDNRGNNSEEKRTEEEEQPADSDEQQEDTDPSPERTEEFDEESAEDTEPKMEPSEEEQDKEDAGTEAASAPVGPTAKELTGVPLKRAQAKAWLESLPDTPILIQRHKGEPIRRESRQQW